MDDCHRLFGVIAACKKHKISNPTNLGVILASVGDREENLRGIINPNLLATLRGFRVFHTFGSRPEERLDSPAATYVALEEALAMAFGIARVPAGARAEFMLHLGTPAREAAWAFVQGLSSVNEADFRDWFTAIHDEDSGEIQKSLKPRSSSSA